MSNINIYNQVKMLFEADNMFEDIAMKLFFELKRSTQYGENKVELYIYSTKDKLNTDLKYILDKYSEAIDKFYRTCNIINFKNGTRVYLKTIEDCIRGLDGFKIGRVEFR